MEVMEGVNPKSVAMQMGESSVAFMLQNYERGWAAVRWTRL